MKSSLSELRAFVTVAETGHFTRAAERLEMSQSALSAHVVKLERLLGTQLFDRHTRSSSLTAAGTSLLPDAHRLVQDWERLVSNARGFAALTRGRITVAAPSGQAALLMPPLVREFVGAHPGVKVQLRDVPEQEVHELVRSGAADLGVASETDARSDLLATPFYSDQYIASMHANHPLAKRRTLEWSHVCAHEIIGPMPDNPVRRHLDERLAQLGLRLNYSHEVSLAWTMVGLAREGLGVAVLTTAARPLMEWRQLVVKTISRPLIGRTLVVLRRPDRALPPLAAAFRDLLMGGTSEQRGK